MGILFHLESGKIKLHQRKKIKTWLGDLILSEGYRKGKINIILTNDQSLLKLNQEFLSEDCLTDIITFDYSEKGKISGDMYISVDRVLENARIYGVPEIEELLRIFAHGMLHLTGYGDKSEEEKAEMKRKEDYYLQKILLSI